MITSPAPKIDSSPVDKGMGTQSEVMAKGGGGDANSTRMNTVALGGFNPNLIGSHTVGITAATKGIADAVGKAGAGPKISNHLDTIMSHVKSLQTHIKTATPQKAAPRPAYQRSAPKTNSEADAGDMSHYDPDLGMGKK